MLGLLATYVSQWSHQGKIETEIEGDEWCFLCNPLRIVFHFLMPKPVMIGVHPWPYNSNQFRKRERKRVWEGRKKKGFLFCGSNKEGGWKMSWKWGLDQRDIKYPNDRCKRGWVSWQVIFGFSELGLINCCQKKWCLCSY